MMVRNKIFHKAAVRASVKSSTELGRTVYSALPVAAFFEAV